MTSSKDQKSSTQGSKGCRSKNSHPLRRSQGKLSLSLKNSQVASEQEEAEDEGGLWATDHEFLRVKLRA